MSCNGLAVVPNVLTIDFESWVHAYRDPNLDSAENKLGDAGYVVEAGRQLLDMMDEYGIKATFFVVGEIGEWYPDLVDEIARRGHEIGLHAYTHRPINSFAVLEDELNRSAAFLKRYAVRGFRAPRGLFKLEYLKLLQEYDLAYDSSGYGTWEAIELVDGVLEIPISGRVYGNSRGNHVHFGPLGWRVLRSIFPFGAPYMLGLAGHVSMRCIRSSPRSRLVASAANGKRTPCWRVHTYHWEMFAPRSRHMGHGPSGSR